MTFPTEQAAARHLFEEATSILTAHDVDFVVVGGWVTLLFHSHRYGHPGTFDLDVLLSPSSIDDGTFEAASESLLHSDYLRAVKNRFQAHRILDVAGERLVFHVDFLNERTPVNELALVGGKGRLHSIYTDAMRAVYVYDEHREYPDLPGLKFPSVHTYIASKAAAALVKKRRRDAFDVYVSVLDQEPSEFRLRWQHLCAHDGLFSDANDALVQAVDDGDAVRKISGVIEDLGKESRHATIVPSEGEIRGTFAFLVR